MAIAKLQIVSGPDKIRKRYNNLCLVAYCKNKPAKRDTLCCKHCKQRYKILHPLEYWYDVLRSNAKRRKIGFYLTVKEFGDFCIKTNYLKKKGKNPDSYTIDRIRSEEGYHKDNIQVLTLSNNTRKQWVDLKKRLGHYPSKEELENLYGGIDEEDRPKVLNNLELIPQTKYKFGKSKTSYKAPF